MKVLFVYFDNTIEYSVKGRKTGLSMNIVTMLRPEIQTLSTSISTSELGSFYSNAQKDFDCVNFVMDDLLFKQSIDTLSSVHEDCLTHIFVVSDKEFFFDDQHIKKNFAYSMYRDFFITSAILALQTSDYHMAKESYRLGYFHPMLALKTLSKSEHDTSSFLPAIYFKSAYGYYKVNEIKKAIDFYNQALNVTVRNFREKEIVDIGLTFEYMFHFVDLLANHKISLKDDFFEFLFFLEKISLDESDNYKKLGELIERLIEVYIEDTSILCKLFLRELNFREKFLSRDDRHNTIRYAICCKQIADKAMSDGDSSRAHHFYVSSLMTFLSIDNCKDNCDDLVSEVLTSLDYYYSIYKDTDKHPSYLKNKSLYMSE